MSDELKTCSWCKQAKPRSEFSPKKITRDKLDSWCKACNRERARLRREKNRKPMPPEEPIPDGMKKCPKCDLIKPVSDFNRNRATTDGLAWQCRQCDKEYRQAHYAKNREKILAANRQWRIENPEKYEECSRAYYEANRDKKIENAKRWATDNPERTRARARKGARVRRAKLRGVESDNWTREGILERDGLLCSYCGYHSDDPTDFEIDHIYPLSRGGSDTEDNLTVACRPCNRSKFHSTLLDWKRLPSITLEGALDERR